MKRQRTEGQPDAPTARPTRGVVYYYCGQSATPMEDGTLRAPFDDPSNLAKNVEAGVVTGREVTMHDGRVDDELMGRDVLDKMTVLDTRGMMLQAHTSAVTDFWDERQILDVHYPEMQRLSQALTRCDRTVVAAHALRGLKTPMGRPAAYFTHNDFSDRLKPLYLALLADGLRAGRTDALALLRSPPAATRLTVRPPPARREEHHHRSGAVEDES